MAEGGGGGRRHSISDDYDDDEERAKEVKELQKRGILPRHFPMSSGDQTKYDSDDACEEIEKLLQLGAISPQVASNLKQKQSQDCDEGEERLVVFDSKLANSAQVIPPFTSDGLPLSWNRDVNRKHMYTLIRLDKGEPEFDMIAEEFERVNVKVKRIERLQNERLLNRFKAEMEEVAQHREQGFSLNIRYLYHGTNVEKRRLCEEGLDQRLSRMGFFGKGIYFSDNPIKCVHYAEDSRTPDEASILKCRVILGDSKVFKEGLYDTTLKREPEKENPGDGWRYYDSVVGCPKNYNEYVVYENRRAMIEYIISFKVDDNTANNIKKQNIVSVEGEATHCHSGEVISDGFETDHVQRISDVREAVRRRKVEERGSTYNHPFQKQVLGDWRMFPRLRMHDVDPERQGTQAAQDESQYWEVSDDPPLTPSDVTLTDPSASRGYVPTAASDWSSTGQWMTPRQQDVVDLTNVTASPASPDDSVERVFHVCVAEFKTITTVEDTALAKFYLKKADMDVNKAISFYYEDNS